MNALIGEVRRVTDADVKMIITIKEILPKKPESKREIFDVSELSQIHRKIFSDMSI